MYHSKWLQHRMDYNRHKGQQTQRNHANMVSAVCGIQKIFDRIVFFVLSNASSPEALSSNHRVHTQKTASTTQCKTIWAYLILFPYLKTTEMHRDATPSRNIQKPASFTFISSHVLLWILPITPRQCLLARASPLRRASKRYREHVCRK